MSNSKRAKGISRDSDGLIEGLDYVFNEDGFIDWRKMINPKFLVPNKDKTSETDVTKLKDSDLLILIGGIKELAQIRGFTDVSYDISCPSPEYVVMTCKIKWIPNIETEGREITYSGVGDASPFNTSNFAKLFLGPMAENRAFVRCVRNFLKINIVGKEEINPDAKDFKQVTSSDNFADPRNFLQILMNDKKVSFDELKKKLVKEGIEGANEFNSTSDVPIIKVLELIERIKKIK